MAQDQADAISQIVKVHGFIRRGAEGEHVKAIQDALAGFGQPLKPDGIFGERTEGAVIAFQTDHGLTPDGIVGPRTAATLTIKRADRDQDPPEAEPRHIKAAWPRQRDLETFYGPVGKHQVMLQLPFTMRLAWDTGVKIHHFSVHEKVHDSALRCFERIADAYPHAARADAGIDLFGGCLNVRRMRGGSRMSTHSWGIAIDFDPARNRLTWGAERARLAMPDCERFWRIWEDEGWVSLGRTRDFDWMHVQAARL